MPDPLWLLLLLLLLLLLWLPPQVSKHARFVLQTISFVAALLGKGQDPVMARPADATRLPEEGVTQPERNAADRRPILILCPASVISTWEREFAMWGELPGFPAAMSAGITFWSALCVSFDDVYVPCRCTIPILSTLEDRSSVLIGDCHRVAFATNCCRHILRREVPRRRQGRCTGAGDQRGL